jgi:hypothetical protein
MMAAVRHGVFDPTANEDRRMAVTNGRSSHSETWANHWACRELDLGTIYCVAV